MGSAQIVVPFLAGLQRSSVSATFLHSSKLEPS